jgi:thiamine-phosphate pyrophosphorylase
MSAQSSRSAPSATARLYLITPPVDDPTAFAPGLGAALAGTDVAAILLRLAPGDERTQINRVKTLAPLVQDRGVALLLDGAPDLVARAGADGAHLANVETLQTALPSLKPARIAGVGGLTTRHDAMVAAEAGADYVMFGEPDAQGHSPSFEAVEERIAWWAEVFEAPCVGYVKNLDECLRLAAAGADFVAVNDMIWSDSRGPAAAIAELARCMDSAEPVE